MNRMGGSEFDWRKYGAMTVSVLALLFAVWVFFRYGLSVAMPFLLAWVLSLILSPMAQRISARTHLPVRLSAAGVLIAFFASVVLVSALAFRRLFRELGALLALLGEDPGKIEAIIQRTVDFFSEIGERIPLFSALLETEALESVVGDIGELVKGFLLDAISGISAEIPTVLFRVIGATPSVLLFLLVFVIASFYFCLDGERIGKGICALLPQRFGDRISGMRERIRSLLLRYLRVYLVLFLITFTELLIGFLLLGQRYAFLAALLISAMDVLPVIGVGTVLLPWALIIFVGRNVGGAVGLLILWGVITIVRQVLEPRLIGDSFGLHPLLALVSLYAGLRLFGVVGILLGPALVVFLKILLSELKR